MLLKVGELAKRTGLTVRTLHHYDAIGLLTPSARSDAGYRLYDRADVARLHGIQALRRLGLPLAEIGSIVDGDGGALPAIIGRQISALDQEIAQATELRSRLDTLQVVLAAGGQPEMDDWLASLSLMGTYAKYFSPAELKRIFENWKRTEAEWPPLIDAIRAAMNAGIAAEAIEVQPLARRWMDLSIRWMNGDMDLLTRWKQMFRDDPGARPRSGVDRELFAYISQAVELRLATLAKHLTPEEIRRIDKTLEPEWLKLAQAAQALMEQGTPAHSAAARALANDWRTLLDRTARHDPLLRDKLIAAYRNEPLLRVAAALPADAREYIRRAIETGA